MSFNTLTLYKLAFLKRVPFQLSLHLTGAIHSIIFITFDNKAGSLTLDFFKFIDFSFVVGAPHCGSIFKVWVNKTEIKCLPNVHASADSKISPDHTGVDFERVLARCRSHAGVDLQQIFW